MPPALAHCFAPAAPPPAMAPWLRAARLWVMLARAGRNPRPAIGPLLGARGAAAFSTLMEALVVAWAEPFAAYPPCATRASADEFTLLALLAAAEARDHAGAAWLLGEMLPAVDTERLMALAERAVLEAPRL